MCAQSVGACLCFCIACRFVLCVFQLVSLAGCFEKGVIKGPFLLIIDDLWNRHAPRKPGADVKIS